jgi:hypothetical protein
MFGIGPMLPVIPAAENMERSAKKVRKCDRAHETGTGGYELSSIRQRLSITHTESTSVQKRDEFAVQSPGRAVHHQRDLSLHVNWTQDDLKRMVIEIYDGTIPDVHLSLLAYWIKEKNENYQLAREHIRELALDQVWGPFRDAGCPKTDTARDITLTGSQIPVYASYCRMCTIFVQGPYPKMARHPWWLQQMIHTTTDERASLTFYRRLQHVAESGLRQSANLQRQRLTN